MNKSRIRFACRSAVFLSATLVFAFNVQAQSSGVIITGPVPAGPPDSANGILNPSAIELEANGYIEEEYFIEGSANRYETTGLETAEIADTGHPYKTRFIVRRPESAEDFNGTLVIEWNNVTAGRDLDIDWWQAGEYLVRNGYAFIAVSAQRVGVNHLKQTRPERYGDLDVTHEGMVQNDALSYDLFTAIADAVQRANEDASEANAVDILGGLRPEVILATGHSQSASRLATYLNSVHPRTPVFDGVMVHGGGGRIRDDQPVKVFKIMAETDMARRAAEPQPDSDFFRQWEVAGTSHVDIFFELEYGKMLALEEGRSLDDVSPRSPSCELPAYSRVPFRYPMHAAFEHLVVWAQGGAMPPVAPRLALSHSTPELEFSRDHLGNINGGIQLASHAIATAENTGMNSGDAFCRLYGSHEPFSETVLQELYPSHEDYVEAVREVVAANVAAGYVLERDGQATIREAEQSGIGR